MAGRPRKPTALKVINGTDRRDRMNEKEPKPETGTPSMPRWLKDKVAVSEWKRLTSLLNKLGVLTEIDGNALASYCYVVGRIASLSEQIEKTGDMVYDIKINPDTGEEITINPKSNPLAPRLENYIKEERYQAKRFGLDPESRTKIEVNPTGEEKTDKKQRFFK